jgi:UDP-galactopyranose mutase
VNYAADYLVVGAGASGMSFVDVLLEETDASILMVDRRDSPGGHWTDAYPYGDESSRSGIQHEASDEHLGPAEAHRGHHGLIRLCDFGRSNVK